MQHRIVSRDQWLQERTAFLAKEKELTRLRDRLAEERRTLPWVQIDKTYAFDTPAGKKTLTDLFEGRSQLIVKFFMLAPGQKEGCVGCSFEADHVEGTLVHLRNHDVSYVAVARAPLAEIEAFKTRMGWSFNWVSSFGSDFSYDFDASFTPAQLAERLGVLQLPHRAGAARGPVRLRGVLQGRAGPRSSTPTRPSAAAWKRCSAPTCSSTSRQTAATRTAPTTAWPTGCGTTTATAPTAM